MCLQGACSKAPSWYTWSRREKAGIQFGSACDCHVYHCLVSVISSICCIRLGSGSFENLPLKGLLKLVQDHHVQWSLCLSSSRPQYSFCHKTDREIYRRDCVLARCEAALNLVLVILPTSSGCRQRSALNSSHDSDTRVNVSHMSIIQHCWNAGQTSASTDIVLPRDFAELLQSAKSNSQFIVSLFLVTQYLWFVPWATACLDSPRFREIKEKLVRFQHVESLKPGSTSFSLASLCVRSILESFWQRLGGVSLPENTVGGDEPEIQSMFIADVQFGDYMHSWLDSGLMRTFCPLLNQATLTLKARLFPERVLALICLNKSILQIDNECRHMLYAWNDLL